mgnify:CR=1 FL=1
MVNNNSNINETPLMRQYSSIKSKHPDALLLFRVGDFYETFGQDAIDSSKILDIILTKRANGSSNIELAGFPYHSLNTYLPKLVKAGKRVAICEQLEDPKKTKKIVKRGVTELITPGVSYNDQILENTKNNFLASIYFGKNLTGISFLDISTGEFYVAEGSNNYIDKILADFSPNEVLIQKKYKNDIETKVSNKFYFYSLDDWIYSLDYSEQKLSTVFNSKSLKGFGVADMKEALIAAGTILHYLEQTQHNKLSHILGLKRIDSDDYVWLDRFTINNLEIFNSSNDSGISLYSVINKTLTPIGARMLRRWMSFPLVSEEKINNRLEIVNYLKSNDSILKKLTSIFSEIGDIERLSAKIATGRIGPRELIYFKNYLSKISLIKNQLKNENIPKYLKSCLNQLNDCTEIVNSIELKINEDAPVLITKGGAIKDNYSNELDSYREIANHSEKVLKEICDREIKITGISSLKISYNNVFGYYLEVRNKYKDQVPDQWIRKQTLVSAERYITEELKELEVKIINAKSNIIQLECDLYQNIIQGLIKHLNVFQNNANILAKIDCLISFAISSNENNYVAPIVNNGLSLNIKNGRHPVIESIFSEDETYVPNDLFLDDKKQQIIIITGPNMSGKSAILRQTALIVLLAQIGSHVPCDKAEIGLVDKIFTRVGATDNLSEGESTFMVEMNETSSILNNLSKRSLVLLDEIGRGTSTFDGVSIAWAIAEYLHDSGFNSKTLFATHYHELNELAQKFDRIHNYNVSVKELENNVLFLRKLKKGGCHHSFGIHVANMAGMPKKIINRSSEVLKWLESQRSSTNNNQSKIKNNDFQLSFIQLDDPILEEIKQELISTDINSLTPVEALLKLNNIKNKVSKKKK